MVSAQNPGMNFRGSLASNGSDKVDSVGIQEGEGGLIYLNSEKYHKQRIKNFVFFMPN